MRGLSGSQQGVLPGGAFGHLRVHQPGADSLVGLAGVLEGPGPELGDFRVDGRVAPVGAGEVKVAKRLGRLARQREGSAADDVTAPPLGRAGRAVVVVEHVQLQVGAAGVLEACQALGVVGLVSERLGQEAAGAGPSRLGRGAREEELEAVGGLVPISCRAVGAARLESGLGRELRHLVLLEELGEELRGLFLLAGTQLSHLRSVPQGARGEHAVRRRSDGPQVPRLCAGEDLLAGGVGAEVLGEHEGLAAERGAEADGTGDDEQRLAEVGVFHQRGDVGVTADQLTPHDGPAALGCDLGHEALDGDPVGLDVDPQAVAPFGDDDGGAPEDDVLGRGSGGREGRDQAGRGDQEAGAHRDASGAIRFPCSK